MGHLAQARGFGVLSDRYARLGENARLSEVAMRLGVFFVESSSKRGSLCGLSDLRSR